MKITVFLYSLEEYLAQFSFFTIADNTVWTIFLYVSPGKCANISVTAELKVLFNAAIPIIPTRNVWEFLFLHILATLGFVTLANFYQ